MAKSKQETPQIMRVGDSVIMDTKTFDELLERLVEAEQMLDIEPEHRARSWFRP